MTIITEASTKGCMGSRSSSETMLHINYLELKAALLAIQSFVKDQADAKAFETADRQLNSDGVHKEEGRNKFITANRIGLRYIFRRIVFYARYGSQQGTFQVS